MDRKKDVIFDLRPVLDAKTRDELTVLAKELNVAGFSRLQKGQLIDALLSSDCATLKAVLIPTWWHRYHNHVYGVASIFGLVLTILFFMWPNSLKPTLTGTRVATLFAGDHNSSMVTVEDVDKPFRMNSDVQRRDQILGIDVHWNKQPGDAVSLERINVRTLEQLFRERFIDPNDKQNNAPEAKIFLAFMQKHPEVVAHGYAVGPDRKDYRVTIDGLSVQPSYVSMELKLAFLEFCKDADEKDLEDGLWAWWD